MRALPSFIHPHGQDHALISPVIISLLIENCWLTSASPLALGQLFRSLYPRPRHKLRTVPIRHARMPASTCYFPAELYLELFTFLTLALLPLWHMLAPVVVLASAVRCPRRILALVFGCINPVSVQRFGSTHSLLIGLRNGTNPKNCGCRVL